MARHRLLLVLVLVLLLPLLVLFLVLVLLFLFPLLGVAGGRREAFRTDHPARSELPVFGGKYPTLLVFRTGPIP